MREKPARRERTPLPKGFSVLWTTVAIDITGFGIAIPVLGLFAKREFGASAFQVGLLIATYSLALYTNLFNHVNHTPVDFPTPPAI